MPFYPFLGEGSPTKIDYIKKGTLILTSLLEDPVNTVNTPAKPRGLLERSIGSVIHPRLGPERQVPAVHWREGGIIIPMITISSGSQAS